MEKKDVKTLADLIRLSADEFGSKAFIKEKQGKEIAEKSYADLYEDVKRLNGFLKPMGKLHAAVIGATSYNYLVSWFGTVIGGNVIVPIDAQLVCDDICDLLRRADVSVFFYNARFMLSHTSIMTMTASSSYLPMIFLKWQTDLLTRYSLSQQEGLR